MLKKFSKIFVLCMSLSILVGCSSGDLSGTTEPVKYTKEVEANEIITAFETNVVEAERKYHGVALRITGGELASINKAWGGVYTTIKVEKGTMSCDMDDENSVIGLKIGDKVNVDAMVDKKGLVDAVDLDRCSFVKQ